MSKPEYYDFFENPENVVAHRNIKPELNCLWKISADPEKQGLHPLHDNRFIVTEDFVWNEPDNTGYIICALRDLQDQKEIAEHIVELHNNAYKNGKV